MQSLHCICARVLTYALTFITIQAAFDDLMGHMQPIGNQHSLHEKGILELQYIPDGKYFYEHFIYPAKPVVMRGALNNTKAMSQWTNATYMKEVFGEIRGEVDRRKKWKNGGREIVPRSVMNYSEFLDSYERLDLYWDFEIPRDHTLLNDMPLPIALNCFETLNMFLYINLMVNSGNVSYVIHHDAGDNFFHFLSGSKRWLIADSAYSEDLYIGKDVQIKSLSAVNPDSVDLNLFPNVSKVPFYSLELYPGDLLYVPRFWPHYSGVGANDSIQISSFSVSSEKKCPYSRNMYCTGVNTRDGTSVGMNIWFGNIDNATDYNDEIECEVQRVPLSEI